MQDIFPGKKEIDNKAVKDISNLFKLKKENEPIKDRLIRYIMDFLINKIKITANQ